MHVTDMCSASTFSMGWRPSLWAVLPSDDINTGIGNVASPERASGFLATWLGLWCHTPERVHSISSTPEVASCSYSGLV